MGVFEVEDEGLVDGVGGLGHQGDNIAGLGETLEGGVFSVDEDHGDLTVVHGVLAADDDGVAGLDVG